MKKCLKLEQTFREDGESKKSSTSTHTHMYNSQYSCPHVPTPPFLIMQSVQTLMKHYSLKNHDLCMVYYISTHMHIDRKFQTYLITSLTYMPTVYGCTTDSVGCHMAHLPLHFVFYGDVFSSNGGI